ncbi:E3 ubiquitin-protein ligase RNF103-like isoform X2 [Centruroides sculpturatus]|uniref:E3 ubiquitin-protein ligase RNF103-like isoform X2 n=1 Tax=Centruroides sculpturatus TaxID=218467 RepID=UPI000C6D60CF|nr:E3 ubiquitin-protein ligase RNF103-like isoform X2 [Centruroides sculpturatus]
MYGTMWVKILLLSLYLLLLFFLTRLLEAASWYHGGRLFFPTRTVLDPFSLSVRKLKQLLDSRGVSYAGVVEKQELTTLVDASGELTKSELDEAVIEDSDKIISGSSATPQTTQFSCGEHFYEEVEDTKDSVWLVQVIPADGSKPLLDDVTWQQVVSKVNRFGMRTGIFRCTLDKRLCLRKGWTSPRLILALPRGQKAKEDVVMHSYLYPTKLQPILAWVWQQLSSRVKRITSAKKLKDWLIYNSEESSKIRIILFSTLLEPPLFISALAIKFNGRVKFGIVPVASDDEGHRYAKLTGISKFPKYVVITPEKKIYYGYRPGENLNFKSMELFLKFYSPEMNDIFLSSLLLVNVFVGFDIFLISGKLWKHLIRCIINLVKYNSILFLFWLFIVTLYQFSFMEVITSFCLKFTRLISDTFIFVIIRNDWRLITNFPLCIISFFIYGILVSIFWKKWGREPEIDDIPFFSNWWTVSWESDIMNYFFRPMATLTRPMAPQDLDLEEGMELLIERLAVPNFWLQPVIPTDYINDLPIWNYHGWCDADDKEAQEKGWFESPSWSSSDDESTSFAQSQEIPVAKERIPKETNSTSGNQSKANNSKICDCKFRKQMYSNKSSQDCAIKNCNKPNLMATCSDDVEHSWKASKMCSCNKLSNIKRIEIKEDTLSKESETSRAPKGMIECRECSICLENYKYGESLCGLPCGHNYHLNCIMLWLSRNNHCCPVCRWPPYKAKSHNYNQHFHFQ